MLPFVRCLVELSAALRFRKTVVMLIGDSDGTGRFVPNRDMLGNLLLSIDVQQAHASVDDAVVARLLPDFEAVWRPPELEEAPKQPLVLRGLQ